MDEQLLDEEIIKVPYKNRRRNLLPWWIKVFAVIFLIFGVLMPVAIIFAFLGKPYGMSIYGLSSYYPFSFEWLLISAIFLMKGILSVGLLTEKDWAIDLGIIDAYFGISICAAVMIIPIFASFHGLHLNLRLELVALIPFLSKLKKIKPQWIELKYP